jgi:hypothetical protein
MTDTPTARRLPEQPEMESADYLRRRVAAHLDSMSRDQVIALIRWLTEQERGI